MTSRSASIVSRPLRVGVLATLGIVAACADPFSTVRNPPPRGTVGQELYGVVCDRIGAQALPEDLSGASFEAICHPDASGNYASAVDQSQLPPVTAGAVDVNGNP